MTENSTVDQGNTAGQETNEGSDNQTQGESIDEKLYGKDESSTTENTPSGDEGNQTKQVSDDSKSEDKTEDKVETPSDDQGEVDYSEITKLEMSYLEKEDMQKVVDFAKDKKLSVEATKEILKLQNDKLEKNIASYDNQIKERDQKWVKEIQNDKDFGGDSYKETVQVARDVIKQYGDEGFIKDLDDSGYGNSPGLIRLLCRIGKEFQSDKLTKGEINPHAVKDVAEVFYGKSN